MRIVRYQYPRTVVPRTSLFSPWAGWGDEFDRLVSDAFSGFLADDSAASASSYPRADLYEDKDNFHFRAELPGLKKDDIQVELGEGVLTVSGTRKSFGTDGKAAETSRFSRSISVPARVQESAITAHYEDGILTVTLPKAEEVKPKRIAVQVK